MDKCSCLFFVMGSGKKPVEDFISSLDTASREKFNYVKDLLEEYGHRLCQPYSKYLGKSIFELRFETIEGSIRVLYFFLKSDAVVLTNCFIKKSDKTPKKEIGIALKRRKMLFEI